MSLLDTRARAHEDAALKALLARLLAAALSDEVNIAAYHAAVDRYPGTAILCAYETARNLPAALVRKSRGAYFTFLLQRLCPAAQGAASLDPHDSDQA